MGRDLKLTERSDKNSCPTLCVAVFFFFFLNIPSYPFLKKIYLAASSLSRGTWDLVA